MKFNKNLIDFFYNILCLYSLVPSELSVMRKEYFNKWYSISTYYISVTFVDLPVQVNNNIIICCKITNLLQFVFLDFLYNSLLSVNLSVIWPASYIL